MEEKKIHLKHCPCCGGKAELQKSTRPDGGCHYSVVFVKCTECGMQTRELISDGYYDEWHTPEEAAKLWNRRCSVPCHYLRKAGCFIITEEEIRKALDKNGE